MMMEDEAMQHNGLDVSAIHPRNGKKYSPNLYKWLTQRGRRRDRTSRVFRDKYGGLLIGYLHGHDFIGAGMIGALCNGAGEGSYCYPSSMVAEEVADFWTEYAAIGRCAIDKEHAMSFVGDDTRWQESGDERSCLWCGQAHQSLVRWTETTEHQEWRPRKPGRID